MFTTSLFLILPALVAAQYGAPPPGPATQATTAAPTVPSAPASSGTQFNVDVAFQGNFVFNPPNITAPVGSLVTFYFPGGSVNHSVTQSSFANPCTYLASTSNTSAGFDSGLVSASTFTINITDAQPIWFHCKQQTHCGLGMVGSINAPATGNTFDSFKSAAVGLGSAAPTESDHGAVTGGLHGIASAAPSSDAGSTSGGGGTSDATKVMATGFAVLSAAVLAALMA